MAIEKEAVLKWLKEYWFIGSFLVVSGMA